MYDENNNFLGVVGFSGWREVAPDSTYRLRVGAIDYDTNRIAWSQSREVVVPLGALGLRHLSGSSVHVPLGGQSLHTFVLSMSPDVFYEVMVEVDLWNLPPEVDVEFVDAQMRRASDGYVSPRGRLAPASPPAGPRNTVVSASRVAPDGSLTVQAAGQRANFDQPLTLVISAAPNAPEGVYTIPIRASNGPFEVELPLRLVVGQAKLYLPVVTR